MNLAVQFEHRTASKEYFAIVAGSPNLDRDLIDLPIGLHPHHREKMAVRRDDPASRPAQSFYEVLQRFDGFASVRVAPKTGRTHQIRVHLASIGCPVLCDRAYGGRARLTRGELRRAGTGRASGTQGGAGCAGGTLGENEVVLLERQALHAHRLRLVHPETGRAAGVRCTAAGRPGKHARRPERISHLVTGGWSRRRLAPCKQPPLGTELTGSEALAQPVARRRRPSPSNGT